MCGNFFQINRSRDIQVSVILSFRKIVLHNKIINKTRSTKNQENFAHHLERVIPQIISENVCKIALKTEELELLEYALVVTFFKKIVSEGFLTSFNF